MQNIRGRGGILFDLYNAVSVRYILIYIMGCQSGTSDWTEIQ